MSDRPQSGSRSMNPSSSAHEVAEEIVESLCIQEPGLNLDYMIPFVKAIESALLQVEKQMRKEIVETMRKYPYLRPIPEGWSAPFIRGYKWAYEEIADAILKGGE